MSRKPPSNPNPDKPWPPDVKKQSGLSEYTIQTRAGETRIVVQTREYKLITPLFGGGVEPGVNDLDNLIRGPEIRGQLRFWWRAIRGGQPEFEGKPEKMKAREDAIWGAASNTSNQQEVDEPKKEQEKQAWNGSVQIEVEVLEKGQPVKPFELNPKERGGYKINPANGIPGYEAFPMRPDTEKEKVKRMGQGTPLAELRQNIKFTLTITFPEKWTDDVLASLWAWETFGGVGARTRRGFGALQREDGGQDDLPPGNLHEAEIWLRKNLEHWCAKGTFPENVSHLAENMRIRIAGPATTPMVMWKNAIDKLEGFRQAPDGRDGRSKWPEAETLRNMTGYRITRKVRGRYEKLPPLPHPQKFPRAVFGLPLIFHFKDGNEGKPLKQNLDPPEMRLEGANEGQERWSSPLILRPLLCQKGRALSMACLLEGTGLPEKMHLKAKDDLFEPFDITRSQTRLESGETNSLPVLHGQTNVLQAFLDYFIDHSFRSEKRK